MFGIICSINEPLFDDGIEGEDRYVLNSLSIQLLFGRGFLISCNIVNYYIRNLIE